MFLMLINSGGTGTGVSLGGCAIQPATAQARLRRGAVAVTGDLPTRRTGAKQLI